jgi:predicted nucleic acid-binding protein
MVLVDTSVWIEHFRRGEPRLVDSLSEGLVLTHPWIIGELACGNLRDRAAILADLSALPVAAPAADSDVLALIENRKLWGRGLGWIDMHLLASTLLSNCQFWTLDKRLARAARDCRPSDIVGN